MKRTIEATGPNVLTVRCSGNGHGEMSQWVLLTTDEHWDNPKCKRDLLRRHYDEAVARDAGIINAGDFFCAMQGKYDKRSNKSDIRPEHQRGDYLDSLVSTASDWLKPYAKNLWVLGRGNHESSIKNRHETDLTERTVAMLRMVKGSTVHAGGYTGWVRFMFQCGNLRQSIRLWYCHGWGGGGPVTINTIQAANRMPMMIDGADVIFTGHVHECWVAEKPVVGLSDCGKVQHRTRYIVQGATYKEEYGDGSKGWHVETGKPPKPIGAWWMHIRMVNREIRLSFQRAD